MSETEKSERPRLVSRALRSLGALQMLAELLEIDDLETSCSDLPGEIGLTVSDLLSELVDRFTERGEVKKK